MRKKQINQTNQTEEIIMSKKPEVLKILDVNAFKIASNFVSKDDTRHNINGIRIDKEGGVTATDGHIMFHMPKCVEPPSKPVTVRLSRTFASIKGLHEIYIDLDREAIDVKSHRDWKKGQLVQLSYDDFPDTSQVIPDKKDRSPIPSFNMSPKNLVKVAKALGTSTSMSFFGGKDETSVIQVETDSLPDAIIIIMPMRM